MTFAWPQLLWLLLAPAALLAAELLRRRRAAAAVHPKILQAEAGTHDLTLVRKPAATLRWRPWLFLGLSFAIIALARPQYGRLEEPVFDQSREIIIAIDLSRSMLSQDVKPSRLERAKLLTQSLLEKLAGERVGLITFSGTAFLQSPLSSDYEILREFLPALNPDFLPEGGTNYRALIDTAITAFGTSNAADRFLIVLSDGEATDGDWKPGVPELRKKGIRVIGLGVGTAAGAMIPDGAGSFMKDERGAVVLSKLESGTLQDLAEATHGTYRDASSWIDLAGVLRTTVEAGQKGRFLDKTSVRLAERFQWPLAFGLWCLLVSFCYEFPVHPRPRELQLRGKFDSESPESASPGSKGAFPDPKSAKLATAATLAVLIALSGFRFPQSVLAAAAEPADAPAPLAKIVSRLSTQDGQSARDWAELARETVTWGQHIQTESRPVPAGPVRDALAATELGSALDPRTADWPKLREDLAALLKTSEDNQKKPQQDQRNQNQPDQQNQPKQDSSDQNQQQQNQQKPDQPKSGRPKQQSSPSQQSQDSPSQSQPQDTPDNRTSKPDGGKKPASAFGSMQESDHRRITPAGMQKVGGTPEKKDADTLPADPQLVQQLQKLDQLRNQDSPAQLFQLMDPNQKNPPKTNGKNW